MVGLYRDAGLDIYEKAHYSHEEHILEVNQILSWYRYRGTRILDIGCSGGLHALEFARRGFSVTGLDIEPSAIRRAKQRSKNQMVKARFRTVDIKRDALSALGEFDLIYSIGNVMSHIPKDQIYDVLRNIRKRLKEKGVFLFDLLMKGSPFQQELREDNHKILWKRKLDEQTGMISMIGIFSEFGLSQHFDVWGYSLEEIYRIVNQAGFNYIDFSDKLDFPCLGSESKNPACLNFRARMEGGV